MCPSAGDINPNSLITDTLNRNRSTGTKEERVVDTQEDRINRNIE